jgi:hypothetical protein
MRFRTDIGESNPGARVVFLSGTGSGRVVVYARLRVPWHADVPSRPLPIAGGRVPPIGFAVGKCS